MKTLLGLFSERQEAFVKAVDEAPDLTAASQVLQAEFATLERIAAGDLTPPLARYQGFLLEALRAFSPILAGASRVDLPRVAIDVVPGDREIVLKVGQLLLSMLLFLSLISVSTLAALFSFLLLVSLARELSIQLSRIEGRIPAVLRPLVELLPWKASIPRDHASQLATTVSIRCSGVVAARHLGNALDVVDRAVDSLEEGKNEDAGKRIGIEQFPEFVDFVQELLGPALAKDADVTLRTTKQLPQLLRKFGLRVESFDPASDQGSSRYFVIEPSIDPNASQYQTVVPALLTSDGTRVVRQGRVSAPAHVPTIK